MLKSSPPAAPDASEWVSRDALLKLAYVLKEAYEEAKREGYRIIDGKLVNVLTDSQSTGKDGTISEQEANTKVYGKEHEE